MKMKDIIFAPHNDIEANDMNIVLEHENLIKEYNYSGATTLLDNSDYKKGFRASLFNSIQNKIRELQLYLLNEFVAEDDEVYKLTEPTDEEMNEKTWWIQPY